MTQAATLQIRDSVTAAPTLKISGLNVYYGESHILRDVDMTIPQGKMVCLIGRNGVGKTTLLKTVMGLLAPRSGRIDYQGKSLLPLPTNRRAKLGIGYVPQGREVIPRLTVKENLLVGLEAKANQKGNPLNSEIPGDILKLFPVLAQMLSRMGGDLSGGQQQQLAIARGLMCNPKIMLLDEPTEGIQPSIVQEIEDTLRRINKEKGITIVVVEQKIEFARKLAQKFFIMKKGSIVEKGTTDQLSDALLQKYLAV